MDSSDDSDYELVVNETSRGSHTHNKVGPMSEEMSLKSEDRVVDIYTGDVNISQNNTSEDHEEYMRNKRYYKKQPGQQDSAKDGTKTPIEENEWFTGSQKDKL